MSKVSIATRPLVYSTFRYINNTPWNALAEYIDNSLQSFIAHQDILTKINPDGKLRIDIQMNQDTIVIRDNAWGIEEENYQRAFELANIPLDASGLSEFGMGMKVSSIWLSNVWKVETCEYGTGLKKTVVFDLEKVVQNQETEMVVLEESVSKSDHYTVVTLTQLSQNRPKQFAAVKRHLSSTYVKFIRDGILELVVNDELLTMPEPKVLFAPYYKDASSKDKQSIQWREEINFEAGKYKVKGFIGVLEVMSNNKENGFLIFRRGRAIGNTGDDKLRPIELCGQVGSPQYKRIFGELEVEGFDVSFQKNSFQEDEAFSQFIEDISLDLKAKIKKNLIKDIFGQAQHYIKDRTVQETKKTAKTVVSTLAKNFSKPIEVSSSNDADKTLFDPVPSTNIPNIPDEIKEAAKYETTIPVTVEGKNYNLKIQTVADGSMSGLYTYTKLSDNNILSRINLANNCFNLIEGSEEELNRIIYFIKILIITEISMMHSSGVEFRQRFNQYFGTI